MLQLNELQATWFFAVPCRLLMVLKPRKPSINGINVLHDIVPKKKLSFANPGTELPQFLKRESGVLKDNSECLPDRGKHSESLVKEIESQSLAINSPLLERYVKRCDRNNCCGDA